MSRSLCNKYYEYQLIISTIDFGQLNTYHENSKTSKYSEVKNREIEMFLLLHFLSSEIDWFLYIS